MLVQIGNGFINFETDVRGMYEYYGSHALVSDEITDRIIKSCNFSPEAASQPDECIEAAEEAIGLIAEIIDDYNIYAPWCLNTSLTQYPKKSSVCKKFKCHHNNFLIDKYSLHPPSLCFDCFIMNFNVFVSRYYDKI